jgi:hypothetical protein
MKRTVMVFQVCAFNGLVRIQYSVIAHSSFDAAIGAVVLFGDEPCKVNVTPLKVSQ